MSLPTAPYTAQAHTWPESGRHILCYFDDEVVVAYQFHPAPVAEYAVDNGHFLGAPGYTLDDSLWFTPRLNNAVWGADGWDGCGQRLLAIHIDRVGFDALLRKAVLNTFHPARFKSRASWQRTLQSSWVRVDWEPDRDLYGNPQRRHVLKVGLLGKSMMYFANGGWIVKIEDETAMLESAQQVIEAGMPHALHLPPERVYSVYSAENARWLGVSPR